jgi:hypothetical protein
VSNTPEHRGCRLVYVLGLPALLVCCVGLIAAVILITRDAVCSWPLLALAFATFRHIRWAMIWLSTPAEKCVLAPGVEREPLWSLALRLLLGKRATRTQDCADQPGPDQEEN